jgi:hypothetical protein
MDRFTGSSHEDGALEAMTGFAKTIDGLARQVEDVVRGARRAAGCCGAA